MSVIRVLTTVAVAMLLGAGGAWAQNGKGALVLAGGEVRFDNTRVWGRFVELAGGEDAPVVVVPAASSIPEQTGPAAVRNLIRYGANAELVRIAPKWKDTDYKAAARDPAIVAKLRRAKGIWFIGGSQERITEALFDGKDEAPALAAIRAAHAAGAVIGGSSAGTAIMSRWMFANPEDSINTLKFGILKGKHVDRGLGFIGDEWFVDQHFLRRGRFARALCAMQAYGYKYGIGVDEDTAVVSQNGEFEVIGYSGALVLDISAATTDRELPEFNMKKARLTYLDTADRMDAKTLEVKPSAVKRGDTKIDPKDKDTFDPGYNAASHRYFADILGNLAIYAAMRNALDSRRGEVVGLAFTQPEGGKKNDLGFTFKVYRGDDTVGWRTSRRGYESYTLVNLYLDVTPVKLANPLYTPLPNPGR